MLFLHGDFPAIQIIAGTSPLGTCEQHLPGNIGRRSCYTLRYQCACCPNKPSMNREGAAAVLDEESMKSQ